MPSDLAFSLPDVATMGKVSLRVPANKSEGTTGSTDGMKREPSIVVRLKASLALRMVVNWLYGMEISYSRSQESEVRSQESGVRSQESGVRSKALTVTGA